MTISARRFGGGSLLLEALSLVIYLVLLAYQRKVGNDAVEHYLLAASMRMVLLAGGIAMVGLFVDRKKGFTTICLLATLPILLVMAGWQGIW
jgi:hypothetical protein